MLMESVSRGKVSSGWVVLPAGLRQEFGIEDGTEVIFSRTEHGIEIKTLDEAIKQAQATVRRDVPEGVSLVDELLEDRRQDAALD
jgi:bifunctional DNA-binding transcriptional regulator/antitoxin component of YhaV-PrlF toxin-antitoxin module